MVSQTVYYFRPDYGGRRDPYKTIIVLVLILIETGEWPGEVTRIVCPLIRQFVEPPIRLSINLSERPSIHLSVVFHSFINTPIR